MRQGRLLHGVEHQHIGHGAHHRHGQGKTPLGQPQRAGRGQVAQHYRRQQAHAHKVAHVVHQDGRHQQKLDRIAIDHRVAGNERPRENPVGHPLVHPCPCGRVVRGAQQARAARDQKDATDHAHNAQGAQRRDLLTQQRDGHQRRQERPRAPRQRIDHREVRHAVAAQQDDEVRHMQQPAGDHEAPFHRTPQRHRVAPQPPAQRRPDDHHDHRGEERKPRVPPGLLGHDVPAGVDEAREDDEGEGGEGHGSERERA